MATNNDRTSQESQALSQVTNQTNASRFRWSQGDKISNLFQYLANYKSSMENNNSDFKADKVKQYEAFRQAMSKTYFDEPGFCGPEHVTPMDIVNEEDPQKC